MRGSGFKNPDPDPGDTKIPDPDPADPKRPDPGPADPKEPDPTGSGSYLDIFLICLAK